MPQKRKRKKHSSIGSSSQLQAGSRNSVGLSDAASQKPINPAWLAFAGGVTMIALVWAYWPTLVNMVNKWNGQQDYSHGYLVLPLALGFLWTRRQEISLDELHPSLWGAFALLLAGIVRVFAGRYYMTPLDGWTLPLTVAGLVWLLAGYRCLRWALPAIVFLWFMMPIPYSAERWLRIPLQRIATDLSTAVLVSLGQPAIAEGNTIMLGEHQLFVEEACSGLRIMVGIFALAFAFILFSRWSWWQKLLVLAVSLPVAMVANVIRIVATGILAQFVSGKAAHVFLHDVAGFVMIPLAALLFWLFLIYLDKLFPEVEEMPRLPMQQVSH